MRIVEIKALENGAHRNQEGTFHTIPEGWAVVPDNLTTENFPFGEIVVEEIDGVKTVTVWNPGVLPEPEPIPDIAPEPSTDDVLNTLLGVTIDG